MKSMTISIGHFVVPILSKVPDTLCCLICSNILVKPQQGPCGCRFCFECIVDYLKSEDRLCPGQTEDCQEVKLNIDRDLRPDILAKREINKLIVKCPLYLCNQECEVIAMNDHLTICSSLDVSCDLCNELIFRCDYDNHLEKECNETMVSCISCHVSMKRFTLRDEHHKYEHDNLCMTYSNYCPNDCGEIDKVIWSDHRQKCSKSKVLCPYHAIGCTISEGPMKTMSKHMTDYGFHHSEMLLKHIENLNNEIACLNASLTKVTKEKEMLVKIYGDNCLDELQSQKEQIDVITVTINNMQRDSLKMSSQFRKIVQDEIAIAMRNNNNIHSATLELTNNELTVIKRDIEVLKKQSENAVKVDLKKPINNVDIDEKSIKLCTNERFNVSKPKRTDMVLYWKIPDFPLLHNLASPNFYTHPNGYKMSLSMLKVKKGYLSIYAHLRSGEYDNELSWPFRKCVTIRIVDQQRLGRDYEKIILFNEMAGKVCDRKYFLESGDYGFSNFIAYDELKQKPYFMLKNKLLIHCFVDDLKI